MESFAYSPVMTSEHIVEFHNAPQCYPSRLVLLTEYLVEVIHPLLEICPLGTYYEVDVFED